MAEDARNRMEETGRNELHMACGAGEEAESNDSSSKSAEDNSREHYGYLIFGVVVFLPIFAKWQLGIRPFTDFFDIPYWAQLLIVAIAGAAVFKLMFGKGGKTARCLIFGLISVPIYFILLDLYLSVREHVFNLEFAAVGIGLYLPIGWLWRRLDRKSAGHRQ